MSVNQSRNMAISRFLMFLLTILQCILFETMTFAAMESTEHVSGKLVATSCGRKAGNELIISTLRGGVVRLDVPGFFDCTEAMLPWHA